jgi:hypothetical protein
MVDVLKIYPLRNIGFTYEEKTLLSAYPQSDVIDLRDLFIYGPRKASNSATTVVVCNTCNMSIQSRAHKEVRTMITQHMKCSEEKESRM